MHRSIPSYHRCAIFSTLLDVGSIIHTAFTSRSRGRARVVVGLQQGLSFALSRRTQAPLITVSRPYGHPCTASLRAVSLANTMKATFSFIFGLSRVESTTAQGVSFRSVHVYGLGQKAKWLLLSVQHKMQTVTHKNTRRRRAKQTRRRVQHAPTHTGSHRQAAIYRRKLDCENHACTTLASQSHNSPDSEGCNKNPSGRKKTNWVGGTCHTVRPSDRVDLCLAIAHFLSLVIYHLQQQEGRGA